MFSLIRDVVPVHLVLVDFSLGGRDGRVGAGAVWWRGRSTGILWDVLMFTICPFIMDFHNGSHPPCL